MSLQALEQAPPAPTDRVARYAVADPAALGDLCTPLGPRIALVQVRSPAEWSRLARIIGVTHACPDLRRGTLIGLLCRAGTPLRPGWPIRVNSVRVKDGGGLVRAEFAGGSYLPDGTAYLEMVFVPDLAAVLAVDVNGALFYPGQQPEPRP